MPAHSDTILWDPGADRREALAAALLPDERAIAAWDRWAGRSGWPDADTDYSVYRILPLIYRNLSKIAPDHAALPRLKGLHRHAWVNNTMLFRKAGPPLGLLLEAGCTVALCKGAPMASLHYEDIGARPMTDIDIIVPEAQAVAALKILLAAGGRSRFDTDPYALLERRHSLGLSWPEGGEIDLHKNILPENGSGTDADAWAHAVPMPFGEHTLLRLAVEDELLLTCAHGWRWNAAPTLRWVADAVLLIRKYGDEMDWDRFVRSARERQLAWRMYCALSLAARDFDAAVPAETLAALRDGPLAWFEQRETAGLLRPHGWSGGLTTHASFLYWRSHGPPGGPRWWLGWLRHQFYMRFAPAGLRKIPWAFTQLATALHRRATPE